MGVAADQHSEEVEKRRKLNLGSLSVIGPTFQCCGIYPIVFLYSSQYLLHVMTHKHSPVNLIREHSDLVPVRHQRVRISLWPRLGLVRLDPPTTN